jgi:hypothetical protein
MGTGSNAGTASQQWKQLLGSPTGTAGGEVKPAPAAEPDDGRPDLKGPYRAFGIPRAQPLRSLFLYFNAAERKQYGKKKVQIQYEHLDTDHPDSEGFAADGRSFSFVVATGRGFLRFTVHGWDLEEGYDQITFHRMPWIRSFDGTFQKADGKPEGPVITGIGIEEVKEKEPPTPVPAGQRVAELAD